MNNFFIRDFVFDEEQKQTLVAKFKQLESKMTRAAVYNRKLETGSVSEIRKCHNIPFTYKEFPDISLELHNLLLDLTPDYPEDLWFAQFEFIKYEGIGEQFLRHNDDEEHGKNHNRLFTSVTMIERSEDLVGGKLQIWTPSGKDYSVDLQPFETIIFPAHYDHEATPLLQGRRVVLISWAQREGRVLTSQ